MKSGIGQISNDKSVNVSTRGLIDVLSVEIVDASGAQITSFPVTIPSPLAVTQSGVWSVNSVQSGPWSVSATQLGTWNISNIVNPVTVNQGTSPWVISGAVTNTNLDYSLATIDADIKSNITLHAGTNVIGKVSQDTSPWIISGNVTNTGTFAVQNTPVNPTTIYNNKKTVTTAGSRVALATTTAIKSVTVKALASNTGLIYVGDSTVSSTNGFQLSAGETVSMDIADLATVYIDSAVSLEGVSYLAVS